MKKILAMAAVALMAATNLSAQTAEDTVYVFEADQPDVTSLDFMDDMLQWEWGKAQRLTPRGEKASRESMWKAEAMRKVMGEALGIDSITDETMPALSRLLVKAYNTGNENAGVAKDQGWRTRPFLRMNEEPWGQYDDDFLRTNSSYPSGHTAFGWSSARTASLPVPIGRQTSMLAITAELPPLPVPTLIQNCIKTSWPPAPSMPG